MALRAGGGLCRPASRLAASRAWGARRGRIEFGLLRHPLRREMGAHLVQGLNIWLCCALLGGVVAAGGAHFAGSASP